MPVATEFSEEKFELETVLKSGIFDRSPSLAQVLRYVCSKYFAGEADQIKEYNIGVDALGRSAGLRTKNATRLFVCRSTVFASGSLNTTMAKGSGIRRRLRFRKASTYRGL